MHFFSRQEKYNDAKGDIYAKLIWQKLTLVMNNLQRPLIH